MYNIENNKLDVINKSRIYWEEVLTSEFENILLEKSNCQEEEKIIYNTIDDDDYEKILKLSKGNDFMIYVILLYIYKISIYRRFSYGNIAIGVPQYIKNSNTVSNNIFLISPNNLDETKSFKELLIQGKNDLLNMDKNQFYPLEKMYELHNIKEKVNVYCTMNNIYTKKQIDEILKLEDNMITMNITRNKEKINISFIGNNVISYDEIKIINNIFKCVLKSCLWDMDVILKNIDILGEHEKHKVLVEFNDTALEYDKNKTIHELFEEQVDKNPNNIAVVFEDKKLSYEELNKKSNSLARVLREKGIGLEDIVVIMVERSVDMVVGIMAILKAGAAYLPIDSEYPKDRINYILRNSKAKIMLTQSRLKEKINHDINVCYLDDESLYDGNMENLKSISNIKNAAYVIYTSGTTGNPKGVIVENKGIINLINLFREDFKINSNTKILQFASIAFDAFSWELYMSILIGAEIHLVPKDVVMDTSKLNVYIKNKEINVVTLPPFVANEIDVDNSKVELIITAGSEAQKALVDRLHKKAKYVNAYGPTEDTICTSIWKYKDNGYNMTPIGKPISNTKIYILDKANNLLPIGVSGELCISGDGLARGYLNNEKLTAEKFIDNPYEIGQKIYKTGDLARWLPDGNIAFIGRIDSQVKIRGFRIELGEIENQLLKNDEIKEAVVIDREDKQGNKYLCAYIVCDKEMSVPELRKGLIKELPDYMVPLYFIQIDKIPLTSNGKIDREALPEPGGEVYTGVEYAAPTNETEEKLVKVWSEVLGIKKIGIDDDFFTLGGDSIKAIQVATRLINYNLKITVSELFTNSTIRQLSLCVKQDNQQIDQQNIEGEVELTAIQKWFFNQHFTNMNHWNQSFMVYSKEGFHEEIINKVFFKIVEHHDALRIVIKKEGDKIVQTNKGIEDKLFDLSVIDFRNMGSYKEKIEQEATKIQSSINLFKGPLVKLGLFKTKEGDHLLIAIHHLVVDGISWRILLEDFVAGYRCAINKEKIELPLKTHSFKEWSENIQSYAKSPKLLEEIEYWKSIEDEEVRKFPKDYQTTSNNRYSSKSVQMTISKEETDKLLRDTNRAYNTEINDILLAALGLAIKKLIGENKILVNIEGHGREEVIPNVNITRTIGWFTSAYPVILDCEKSNDISYYIKSIKDNIGRIPSKGLGYSILKYITPNEYIKDLEFKQKPQINFNYLGQFNNDVNKEMVSESVISTGDEICKECPRIYDIDINGMVANNELCLNFEYNKDEYDNSKIIELVKNYKKSLLDIINHCTEKKETETTSRDFDYKEVSLEELQDIKLAIGSLFDEN